MKKAQVAGQVFVFMIAIVLAGLILLYGYNAIFGQDGFIHRTEQIAIVRFETDLSSAVSSISSDYGSIKKFESALPSEYQKVCLLDLSKSSGSICNPDSSDYHPIICDAWQTTGNTQNVFLVPMTDTAITVSTLEIEQGSICFPVRKGKVTFWLEGKGDKTKIFDQ